MSGLRGTRSATPGGLYFFAVSGGPNAPSEARRLLERRLSGQLESETLYTARLLLSELVTNCVEHGGASDGRPIDVAGSIQPAVLHVEVSSTGPAFDYELHRPSNPDMCGRGLNLVDALASTWGIVRSPPPAVWFELATGQTGVGD